MKCHGRKVKEVENPCSLYLLKGGLNVQVEESRGLTFPQARQSQ